MIFLAFVKRDILTALSYPLNIALQLIKVSITLFLIYFISRTFSGSVSPHLTKYSGDYFAYVLMGISVSSFVFAGLDAFASSVRTAQVEGTLEAVLTTPVSIFTVLLGNSLWTFILAFGSSIALLGAGMLFLGITLSLTSALLCLAVLLLTFLSFLSVGMLSASFIMVFKQGNPIGMIFGTSSYFLGSVLFPAEVLPGFLQQAAKLLPMTYAVRSLRDIVLASAAPGDVFPVMLQLALFIIILAPAGLLSFSFAVKRARINGSLVQY